VPPVMATRRSFMLAAALSFMSQSSGVFIECPIYKLK